MWVNKIKLRKFIEKVIDEYSDKAIFTIKTTDGKNYTCSYKGFESYVQRTIEVFDKKKGDIVPLTFKSPYEFAYFLNMSYKELEVYRLQQNSLFSKFIKGENYSEITIIK